MLRSLLILTLAALALLTYRVLWQTPAPVMGAALVKPGATTTLAVNSTPPAPFTRELPTLANLSLTVERPLFVQGRRPNEDKEDDSTAVTPIGDTAAAAEPPRLLLTAVFRTVGAELVLLRDLTTGKVASVRLGETFAEWRVESIEAKRVVLTRGEESHTLDLRDAEASARGASQAPQPANLPLRRVLPGAENANMPDEERADMTREHLRDGSDEAETQ